MFTNLHDDEAYYWLFSKHLDWGYFDHPPAIALIIKAGTFLFGKSLLGVRLFTCVASVITWYFIAAIAGSLQKPNHLPLGLAFMATPILQIYGFITTPDVPLFLFGAMFIWSLLKLARNDKLAVFWLAVSMTLLAYSKYHGALVVAFGLLPFMGRRSHLLRILLAGVIALILFAPHLYWQWKHSWPSFQYHLVNRHYGSTWVHIFEYLGGVLLMSGGLLFAKRAPNNEGLFRKSMNFIFWGFIVFFGLSLFNGKIELHWLGFIALPLLLIIDLESLWNSRFMRVLISVQVLVLLSARIVLMSYTQNLDAFKKDRLWADEVESLADGHPVVFMNSFQSASKYSFFTDQIGWSDNNRFYRKNQFDIWKHDTILNARTVYYISRFGRGSFITDDLPIGHAGLIYDYIAMQRVTGQIHSLYYEQIGDSIVGQIAFELSNPYTYSIDFNHPQTSLEPSLYVNIGELEDVIGLNLEEPETSLPAQSVVTYKASFRYTIENSNVNSGTAVLTILKGPLYSQLMGSEYEVRIGEQHHFNN